MFGGKGITTTLSNNMAIGCIAAGGMLLQRPAGQKLKKEPVVETRFLFQTQAVYLFIICLASMLKVACGTARKRALSISLPVTRQMP